MSRRLHAGLIAPILALALLGGACTRKASPGEFRKKAEAELLATSSARGIVLSEVRCETPGRTAVGTVFGCTAKGEAGEEYAFDVLINEPRNILISPRV